MADIFGSIIGTTFSLGTFLICLACAFVCGLITCFAASYRTGATKSYRTSLLLIPMIVTTVILFPFSDKLVAWAHATIPDGRDYKTKTSISKGRVN